jgi:putative ABC transport system permease protein
MIAVILRMSFRSAVRNWRRSTAAILAVTLGFIVLGMLHGFVADLRGMFEERGRNAAMFGDLVVRKVESGGPPRDRWSSPPLTGADQKIVDALLATRQHEVATVVRRLVVTGLVTNGRATTHFLGVGYERGPGVALRGPVWAWDTLAGRPLHTVPEGRPVVLARQLARALECESAAPAEFRGQGGYVAEERPFSCKSRRLQLQAMTTSAQLNALTVDVVGLIEPGSRELSGKYLMMDLPTAQALMDTTDVDGYSVALTDPGRAAGFAAWLTEQAGQRGLALRVQRWQDAPEGTLFRSVVSLLGAFTSILLAAAGLIATFSVFNLLSQGVVERTREIGTLRAMGYRQWQITLLFTAEGLFLAALGSSIGVLLAPLLSGLVSAAGLTFTAGVSSAPVPLRIRIVPLDYLQITFALSLLCVAGAYLPARRASRQAIAKALGHI